MRPARGLGPATSFVKVRLNEAEKTLMAVLQVARGKSQAELVRAWMMLEARELAVYNPAIAKASKRCEREATPSAPDYRPTILRS